MKRGLISIFICTLLISVIIVPAITARFDIISNDFETDFSNTRGDIDSDYIIREVEKKLEYLDTMFQNAKTWNEKIAIMIRALILLDDYNLLPDDTSLEEFIQMISEIFFNTDDYETEMQYSMISEDSEEKSYNLDNDNIEPIIEHGKLKLCDTKFIDKSNYILDNDQSGTIEETITFSNPQLKCINENIAVYLNEATSWLKKSEKISLPVVTYVFILPFKTKVKDVSINFLGENGFKRTRPVNPSNKIVKTAIKDIGEIKLLSKNNKITENSILYPQKQFKYSINAGRYNGKIVNYLSLTLFPVQYDSFNKNVIYWKNADISISYEAPQDPYIQGDEYDMIVISPWWFSDEVTQLVEHKNNIGIRTKKVTTIEIYFGTHFPVNGRDKAEKVKYFIKQALDEWGIRYVLLFGGRNGGLFKPNWWVPARYANTAAGFEESYLCDLYFSDIYDTDGNFSSWDSNGNNVFADSDPYGKDIIDMYPDVFVGRLACRNLSEVKTMINKIITYENTAYGSEWFKRYIGIGGDTWIKDNDVFEGELITETAFSYLDGFNETYLWTSTGAFTSKYDILNETNEGCGFLVFSGHGTPLKWATHLPCNNSWASAPTAEEMNLFQNQEKLPIAFVGGCNNEKFDVSFMNYIRGILTMGLKYFEKRPGLPQGYHSYEWISRCWAWSLANQKEGGCIAIMGNTGYGYSTPGEECLANYEGFLIPQFFKSYGEGKDILGEAYASQLMNYMNQYPPMDDRYDCKVVQEWVLLGDPSLKIGGYSKI